MSLSAAAARPHGDATPPVRMWLARSDGTVAVLVGGNSARVIPVSAMLRAATRSTTGPAGSTTPARTHLRAVASDEAGAEEARLGAEELTILALMADGLALDSVAARVGMSPRTVRRRLRATCDRLAVTHPIQAIVWAVQRGLICDMRDD
jgi:DNA-binding NarL/FixJ family response regulator